MKQLFLTYFGISISVCLVIAALILLAPQLNRRYAAKWKYWIWILLALRLAVPLNVTVVRLPFVEDIFRAAVNAGKSHMDAMGVRSDAESVKEPGMDAGESRMVAEHAGETRKDMERTGETQIADAESTSPVMPQAKGGWSGVTWLGLAAMVWFAGFLIFLGVHMGSYLYYKRQIAKYGRLVTDRGVLGQIHILSCEMRIRRSISVMQYSKAASPMILGFVRPVLVLPEEDRRVEELHFILKHELVHWKRGDVYFKLLFVTVNALHWFNPLVWMMCREAALDMELSCDESVVRGTDFAVRKAYTEALLSAIHHKSVRSTVLSTQFYGGKQIMKKRFENILIGGEKRNGLVLMLGTAVLTVCLASVAGCSALEAVSEGARGENARETAAEKTMRSSELSGQKTVGSSGLDGQTKSETVGSSGLSGQTGSETVGLSGLAGQTKSETIGSSGLNGQTGPETDGLSGLSGQTGPETVGSSGLNGQTGSETNDSSGLSGQTGPETVGSSGVSSQKTVGYPEGGDGQDASSMEDEATAAGSVFFGDGFSIFVPEGWKLYAPDAWMRVGHSKVQFWVAHFKNSTLEQAKKELAKSGYEMHDVGGTMKKGDVIYRVLFTESRDDVWGVIYCYPIAEAEQWEDQLISVESTFEVSGVVTKLVYIKAFDGKTVSFDTVEWVEVPSERASELGVEEDHAPSGFYVYNKDSKVEQLALTRDCDITVLDWMNSYVPKSVTAEELADILKDRKELPIPYELTIQDNEIFKIFEHYVP